MGELEVEPVLNVALELEPQAEMELEQASWLCYRLKEEVERVGEVGGMAVEP